LAIITETFGHVVSAATASGLALIAFADAAAREYTRQGVNGWSVP
jgi:hypothetical protein